MWGETVTHHSLVEVGRDRYNKPIFEDRDTPIEGVLVAPEVGDEVTGDTDDQASSRMTLYFGEAQAVVADDQFTVRGRRYNVRGDEADWSTGMTSWNPGSLVKLERVEYVNG